MTVQNSIDPQLFLGLLIAISIVALAVRYVRVPYSVALVIVGLGLALLPHVPSLQLTSGVILTLFLPVLLFHGAYNLDLSEVRRNLSAISLLAIPGVIAAAVLVAAALHAFAGLSWTSALLFGTIIGATDPVAVLGVFGEMGVPPRLAAIVTGESLFNDGTALVLFSTMAGVATSSSIDYGGTVESFAIAVAGGVLLGAAVGVLGATVLSLIDDALVETVITLIMAYGGYLLADQLHSSGPLETVTAALLLGSRGRDVMSISTRVQAQATWTFLDFLANSLLFLLVGLSLRSFGLLTLKYLGGNLWLPLIVAIVASILVRALVVELVGVAVHFRRPIPRSWLPVITWSGLRGAVSLAAALSLPYQIKDRSLLLTMTFGFVLFTIVLQGLTIGPLTTRLGLASQEEPQHELELLVGRLQAAKAAVRALRTLRQDDMVDPHVTQQLEHDYELESERYRAEMERMIHSSAEGQRRQEYEARRIALAAQRDALQDAHLRGQISGEVLGELLGCLEDDRLKLDSEFHVDGNSAVPGTG